MPYAPAGLNFDPIFGAILLIVASLAGWLWWKRQTAPDLCTVLFYLVPSLGLGARALGGSREVIALFELISVLVGVAFVPLYALVVRAAVKAHRTAAADKEASITRHTRANLVQIEILRREIAAEAIGRTNQAKVMGLISSMLVPERQQRRA